MGLTLEYSTCLTPMALPTAKSFYRIELRIPNVLSAFVAVLA
jgi:hypothetical protein